MFPFYYLNILFFRMSLHSYWFGEIQFAVIFIIRMMFSLIFFFVSYYVEIFFIKKITSKILKKNCFTSMIVFFMQYQWILPILYYIAFKIFYWLRKVNGDCLKCIIKAVTTYKYLLISSLKENQVLKYKSPVILVCLLMYLPS